MLSTRSISASRIKMSVQPASGESPALRTDESGNWWRRSCGSWKRVRLTDAGRFVVFDSAASNLVPGDTNGVPDVFVHDLLTGTTERVSVDSAGGEANGQSVGPGIRGGSAFGARISGDGRLVAFDSIATNLVAGD